LATTPQRAYRAACPGCGAPVEFVSAASASAVCSFCRSTLLRDGDALRRIGVSAELFDDHSPLQLGASGQRQGLGFTLVGRLQYGYDGGTWNEWHALFDNGKSAWLSEDNGAYVIAFDAVLPADAPPLDQVANTQSVGQRVSADGRAWDVASVVRAKLIAAQGELPSPPKLAGEFTVVDLRNPAGEVGTLDNIDPASTHWSVGRSVALSELKMQGLKDASDKTLSARAVECPSCGANLEIKLATTQSIACHQCKAVVDVSQGAGADLSHYSQNNAGVSGAEPQIPLGSTGPLALGGPLAPWQVVGYQERCDVPDSSDEETSFWREYLLFNRTQGFAFLVDSNEGWSWVKPITGAPTVRGDVAILNDGTQDLGHKKTYSYGAKVTWVQGEFYWRVKAGERALVTDYEGQGGASGRRLSREQVGNEVTWSAGKTMAAAEVAAAFGIAPAGHAALQRDVAPFSSGSGVRTAMILLIVVVVVIVLLSQCSSDSCAEVKQTFGAASAEYQQCSRASGSGGRIGSSGGSYGGSYGGYSSGSGGHK
jgi:Domain of unknown function (DUF4178)